MALTGSLHCRASSALSTPGESAAGKRPQHVFFGDDISSPLRLPISLRRPNVAVFSRNQPASKLLRETPFFWKISGFGTAVMCSAVNSNQETETEPVSATKTSFFQDVDVTSLEASSESESFGEVDKILGSRVVDRKTQYLVQWKDDHPDSWEPSENIAADLTAGFDEVWWQAAKKADFSRLKELVEQGRDVDAIESNGRTALHFAAGLGSEKVVKMLVDVGANLQWQDNDGYTPIHIAAGYVHTTIVQALLDLGADIEIKDKQGRTVLDLAEQLLEKLPRNNPMQFARRLALDQVVKILDQASYEEVEVEQILDKRLSPEGVAEYLVRWSDDSPDTWEKAGNIGDDLLEDYERGLEYGIVEKLLDKRKGDRGLEYLVKWADSEEETWEPEDNLAADVIAEFEQVSLSSVEKRLKKKE